MLSAPPANERVARPVPCPACTGDGQLCVVSCSMCAFLGRLSKAAGLPSADVPWYRPEALSSSEAFPCGHPISGWSTAFGYADCPRCGGSGEVPIWKTAAAWARRDKREARRKKQDQSSLAQVFAENGAAMGYSRRRLQALLRLLVPKCEAHSRRTGQPCQNKVVLSAVRCRLHGGNNHGPKTPEGRARISESNRRRKRERSLECPRN